MAQDAERLDARCECIAYIGRHGHVGWCADAVVILEDVEPDFLDAERSSSGDGEG